ncbi:MAG: type II toxin-antitoxin system VapC family toxin [Verrucomicrobia bacterium]|nr:type II toxin-antitoxin system VapC family toxin [Verrucomicrobiota bacterium]
MSVVFADAFYFVARLNRRDQHHEHVLKFSQNLRARLLTSDWVLMEVADALAESECRGRVRDFVLHLRNSSACEIVPASRELLDRALALYHQHSDKHWTLTDCVSFVIMRERNVTEALTGDKHFEQAGFAALLK